MNKKNIIPLWLCFVSVFINWNCSKPVGDEPPTEYIPYSELYSVNSDGSNIQQLTFGKHFIHYADFIPNSNKIYFVQTGLFYDGQYKLSGKQHICIMDLPTGVVDTLIQANVYGDVQYVNEGSESIPRSIVCSSDGKKIYYAHRSPDPWSGRNEIFSVDLQSKQITSLITADNGMRIEHFRISFDETKIVFTEYEPGTKTSFLSIANIDGTNKKLLSKSNSIEYYFPQLLSNNKDLVFIERNSVIKLKTLNIDSLTTRHVGSLDPTLYFYTELTRENNMVVNLNDNIPSLFSLNLISLEQTDLGIQVIAMPFVNKEGIQVLYFDSKWTLKKVTIDGNNRSTIFSLPSRSGTTHVPQASYANDRIIFINKYAFSMKWGERK